jgi:hypothetical protein
LDRSAVAEVDIDLGVVCFVDESGQGFTFAVFFVVFHELLYVPYCLSCIGIVSNSWLVVVSGLGQILWVMRLWRVVFVRRWCSNAGQFSGVPSKRVSDGLVIAVK